MSALLAGLLLLGLGAPAQGEQRLRLVAPAGVALGGFDPVAYFTEGRAILGAPDIALRWRGIRWHFATPAHRSAFEADPTAFVPEFGGFCAVSVLRGRPVPGDPQHWAIVDGRLYLAAGPNQLAEVKGGPTEALRSARHGWLRGPGGE